MAVKTVRFTLQTTGNTEIVDITGRVAQAVRQGAIQNGIVAAFVPGSTAGLTLMEYEPGLVHDLRATLDRLVPTTAPYRHNEHDDNGHAHIRAALTGSSVTVPISGGDLLLGPWQQIVLLDFDTRPRRREVICQLIGD